VRSPYPGNRVPFMYLEYFQMVDRVVALDSAAETIQCIARVPDTSTIFEGHFPGYPLMPGTLLVETVAQVGGFLLMSLGGYSRLPILTQIAKAKVRRAVSPGTELQVDAKVIQVSSGIAAVEGRLNADGKPIVTCEIRYHMMAFPQDNLRAMVLSRARDIGVPVPDGESAT